jgi:hypothetical protein
MTDAGRYVVWPVEDADGGGFTWAHKVTSEEPLAVVCGIPVSRVDAEIGEADMAQEFGECIACANGQTWDDNLTGQMLAEGARVIRGPIEEVT